MPFRSLLDRIRTEPVTALAWLVVLTACVWPLWASGLLLIGPMGVTVQIAAGLHPEQSTALRLGGEARGIAA